ncbi:MAG: polysaccharide pyruvyl transferase family protein [Natronomonas sp.]
MGADKIVGYVGWTGHNNLGDEAIYHAIQRTCKDINLKPSQFADSSTTLLGGGTILPLVFSDGLGYEFRKRNENIALGVGVADPTFENRRRDVIDLRWAAGKLGVDTSAIFANLGIFGTGVRFLGNQLPGTKMDGVFCHARDFRRAQEALDAITVRGPRSKGILNDRGIESKIVGDTALLLKPDEFYPDAPEKIVVTLRTPGTDRKWTKSDDYVDEIAEFCRSIPDSVEKVFLPFYPPDIPLHSDLARSIPNARWEDYTSVVDIDRVLQEISRSRVVIGEKLHASTFAACCYTPFISLEYAPKNADFAASMGMSQMNTRIDDIDSRTLSHLYDTARSYDENEIKSQVTTFRQRLRSVLEQIDRR